MDDFKDLLTLPGPSQYQKYLKERLETLSVRESCVLAAVLRRTPPRDMEEAAYCLNSLDDYGVCLAGNYEELGQVYLQQLKMPEDVVPHVDLEQLGKMYEDKHVGLFIGSYYVFYPKQPSPSIQQENRIPPLWDSDWSVKLKLASPAVPDGVWLRLPDHDGNWVENSSEVRLVLDALKATALDDCTLLEARCILPEVRDLMEQYDSVTELVRDGDNLGFALDEQGQGDPHWLERFAAALEYEGCRTLKFALDISENLHCYDWISREGLADFAAEHLRSCGVSDELIQSGVIDLDSYAEDLLEMSSYMEASDNTGYLRRNIQQFIYEYSIPNSPEMNMQ